MPFDGTDLTPALRRATLVQALRAPLPKGVSFDFMVVSDLRECGSVVCVLGLAAMLWPEHEGVLLGGYSRAAEQGTLFGIDRRAAEGIFWGQHDQYTSRRSIKVTRRFVAAHLEHA